MYREGVKGTPAWSNLLANRQTLCCLPCSTTLHQVTGACCFNLTVSYSLNITASYSSNMTASFYLPLRCCASPRAAWLRPN